MRRGALTAALLFAGVASALACANILGIETLTRADREAGPADDGSAPPDTSVDPCTQDPGPSQPDASTEGTSIPAAWLAANKVDFGATGLNLDNACTLDPASSRCVVTKFSVDYQLDLKVGGPQNVDNAGRSLISTSISGLQMSTALSGAVAGHLWSFAFRLTEYNGKPDDPSVVLQMVTVQGAGADWLVSPESVDGGANDGVASTRAWVHGGQLVAFFDTPLTLPIRASTTIPTAIRVAAQMVLHSAALTADVSVVGNTVSFANGLFGGRWAVADAVNQVGSITTPDGGTICKLVSFQFCQNVADVMLERSQDNGKTECNAISGGFGFSAGTANIVGVQTDAGPLTPVTCNCP